ncbi:MAG TPA: IS200/IS605 family transposase [Gemmatimonadales bacterium]|nr:IS200/IS605 family transposase [Gemmatimonadales bacterium]
MFDQLFVHVTWTTRERRPLITASLGTFLTRFLRQVAVQERAQVLEVGMVNDHVHVLARIHPTTSIPRLLQRWKGGSSALAVTPSAGHPGLKWAKGYAIHSVGPRSLSGVREYLRRQPTHHPDRTIAGWDGDEPEFDAVEQVRSGCDQAPS